MCVSKKCFAIELYVKLVLISTSGCTDLKVAKLIVIISAESQEKVYVYSHM